MLGNFGAQRSRVSINDDIQNDGYEFVPSCQEINGRSNGVRGSGRAASSTLSSKAGIILVSLLSLSSFVNLADPPFFFILFSIGYPQHFHCHSPIPRHWICSHLICPA